MSSRSLPRLVVLAAAVGLPAAPLLAQLPERVPPVDPLAALSPSARGRAVGGGYGLGGNEEVEGGGWHLEASAPIYRVRRNFELRAELLAQRFTGDGTPFDCVVVTSGCFGRADEQVLLGAGVSGVVEWSIREGRIRPYAVPVGIALYHVRLRSTESAGPGALCTDGVVVEPCTDAALAAGLSRRHTLTTLGANIGGGVAFPALPLRPYVELRAHAVGSAAWSIFAAPWLTDADGDGDDGGRLPAGALLVTVGISF